MIPTPPAPPRAAERGPEGGLVGGQLLEARTTIAYPAAYDEKDVAVDRRRGGAGRCRLPASLTGGFGASAGTPAKRQHLTWRPYLVRLLSGAACRPDPHGHRVMVRASCGARSSKQPPTRSATPSSSAADAAYPARRWTTGTPRGPSCLPRAGEAQRRCRGRVLREGSCFAPPAAYWGSNEKPPRPATRHGKTRGRDPRKDAQDLGQRNGNNLKGRDPKAPAR
jgi:hypothetical protein